MSLDARPTRGAEMRPAPASSHDPALVAPTLVAPTLVAPTLVARRRPVFSSALALRRQPFLYLAAALVTGILFDRWLAAPRWVIIPIAVAAGAWSARLAYVKKTTQALLAL